VIVADLIIILGPPASGKTTLALRLAGELAIPMLCKDDVKEALFETLGAPDRAGSRGYSEAAFQAVLRLARSQLGVGLTCLLEGNWAPRHTAMLQGLLAATGARAAQVLCRADPAELKRRFRSRIRHPGHLDESLGDKDLKRQLATSAHLELSGPRFVHEPGDAAAEAELVRGLKFWRL
jgi:predicted kinase